MSALLLRSDVRRGLKRPIFPSNLRLQCPGQALVQNTMTNTSHGVRLQSRRKSWGTLGSTYSFYPNSAPWPEFCRDNHRLSTQTSATESDGLQSQTLSLTSLEFQCLFFLDELSQQQDLRLPWRSQQTPARGYMYDDICPMALQWLQ